MEQDTIKFETPIQFFIGENDREKINIFSITKKSGLELLMDLDYSEIKQIKNIKFENLESYTISEVVKLRDEFVDRSSDSLKLAIKRNYINNFVVLIIAIIFLLLIINIGFNSYLKDVVNSNLSPSSIAINVFFGAFTWIILWTPIENLLYGSRNERSLLRKLKHLKKLNFLD